MFKCCACNKKAKKNNANNRIAENDKKVKQAGKTSNGNKIGKNQTERNDDGKENLENHLSRDTENSKKLDESKPKESIELGNDETSKNDAFDTFESENKISNGNGIVEKIEVRKTEALPRFPESPIKDSSPQQTFLYGAAAYIERTVDDGPDEEGDDSVFEAGPPLIENNSNKKILQGTTFY